MRTTYLSLALLFALGCDGTLTGMAPAPREPETPLPAASVEKVGAGAAVVSEPQPDKIRAQHLLVSYAGARMAASDVKRTREQARERAVDALARIRQGLDFDKVVAAYTDEPGGAARKGDLGAFTRDKMSPSFSDAAFALKVGEISAIVETPFGFHVIRRTE
jgi:peptidyl-prolyl cis-trans isomerase NIMA-interacting 1